MKLNLTHKEIIELRLKCLEPYIATASKVNIDQDTVLKKAELAWSYAIKPLTDDLEKTPAPATLNKSK